MGKAIGRSEKTFQGEFRQSLKSLPGTKFYHKIVDAGFRNPFDAIMNYKGILYGLEYKICKNTISIPLVGMFKGREHELDYLRAVKKSGGQEYILVNIYEPRKRNEILVLDINQYEMLLDHVAPKKSIKLNDPILSKCLFIQKTSDGYDLNPLIK